MKKIYISGRITGNPTAESDFEKAEQFLISKGFEVVNPFNLPHNHDKTWLSYMREDINALVDCDGIYMLKNWKESKGAKIEFMIANSLKMEIIFEDNETAPKTKTTF